MQDPAPAVPAMIDIRSDTVTVPTAAMRKAMAEAEVGDDVYGDDPTVQRLEKLGADLLEKEAALFVPSGTFGNQLALFTWCRRGTEVILGEECHIIQHEAAAASVIAGVQTRPVGAPDGRIPAETLAARLRKRDLHAPATSLLCLENAHSLGMAVPLPAMDEARNTASQWGIPVHLDGARIFNAALALGCTAADIARRSDSVMFCLSKGLCAPVGSLLAGPGEFIEEARYKRKIMGGGMRQAGILAAAGIIALSEHPPLLAEDHRRARQLETALAEIPGITVERGAINMVFFYVKPPDAPASQTAPASQAATVLQAAQTLQTADPGWAAAVAAFRRRGIIINPPDPARRNGEAAGLFRFVVHHWIGDAELAAIAEAARQVFEDPAGRAGFAGGAE